MASSDVSLPTHFGSHLASSRVAESGGTDAEGQAITGHKKAETFAYYRAKANRSKLAAKGINAAFETFDFQPSTPEGFQPQKNTGISDE
jgi:hypothetical protein